MDDRNRQYGGYDIAALLNVWYGGYNIAALLKAGQSSGNYMKLAEHLRSMTASQVDAEVRSIGLSAPDAASWSDQDLSMLTAVLTWPPTDPQNAKSQKWSNWSSGHMVNESFHEI